MSDEKMVPREPTKEMLDAASAKEIVIQSQIARCWRAMYDAAPARPEGDPVRKALVELHSAASDYYYDVAGAIDPRMIAALTAANMALAQSPAGGQINEAAVANQGASPKGKLSADDSPSGFRPVSAPASPPTSQVE